MNTWCLDWGRPGASVLERYTVSTTEELELAIDEIELAAIVEGHTFQVDMWATPRPEDTDPLCIQFVAGSPVRGSLLWHTDGETFAAIEPEVPRLDRNLPVARVNGVHKLEPDMTRIRPESVRDCLMLFLLTRSRPEEGIEWMTIPAD